MQTLERDTVRFLGEILDPKYPLVFARKIETEYSNTTEVVDKYTLTGRYYTKYVHKNDIILKIEDDEKKQEHQFKPFDKVLVKENDKDYRHPDFFVMWHGEFAECVGHNDIKYITPYEGNEHLVGTIYKPNEE